MTLKEKLHKIYTTIDVVEKRGHNKSQNYDYIKAADVTNAIRKQLIELLVYAEINYDFVGPTYTIAREKAPNAPFTAERVKCLVVFHDLESGASLMSSGLGTGADTNDKAAYKAQTGALKYALKNAFLVPDEADPEADETVDEETAIQEYRTYPQTTRDDPPDFQEARHAAPRPAVAPPAQKQAERPAGHPAESVNAPLAPPPLTSTVTAHAAGREPGDDDRPVAPPPNAPEMLGSGLLPTEAELTVYRTKFSKLGDELSTEGKLKSSKGLPINRKLLVFLLNIAKASDAKTITKGQWDDFFNRVTKAKALETGLVGLAQLVNKANGIEEKK